MSATQNYQSNTSAPKEIERRDFLVISGEIFAAIGAAALMWPFIDSLNPSANIRALASVEVDLAPIKVAQRITVMWQGRPVFIVRRTAKEIADARSDDQNPNLIDPQKDVERVQQPEWLIVIGVCTHLGCIPQGQKLSDPHGKYGGWFCACHGSIYDTSGRVRRGPAPKNLIVPPYQFMENGMVRIGQV